MAPDTTLCNSLSASQEAQQDILALDDGEEARLQREILSLDLTLAAGLLQHALRPDGPAPADVGEQPQPPPHLTSQALPSHQHLRSAESQSGLSSCASGGPEHSRTSSQSLEAMVASTLAGEGQTPLGVSVRAHSSGGAGPAADERAGARRQQAASDSGRAALSGSIRPAAGQVHAAAATERALAAPSHRPPVSPTAGAPSYSTAASSAVLKVVQAPAGLHSAQQAPAAVPTGYVKGMAPVEAAEADAVHTVGNEQQGAAATVGEQEVPQAQDAPVQTTHIMHAAANGAGDEAPADEATPTAAARSPEEAASDGEEAGIDAVAIDEPLPAGEPVVQHVLSGITVPHEADKEEAGDGKSAAPGGEHADEPAASGHWEEEEAALAAGGRDVGAPSTSAPAGQQLTGEQQPAEEQQFTAQRQPAVEQQQTDVVTHPQLGSLGSTPAPVDAHVSASFVLEEATAQQTDDAAGNGDEASLRPAPLSGGTAEETVVVPLAAHQEQEHKARQRQQQRGQREAKQQDSRAQPLAADAGEKAAAASDLGAAGVPTGSQAPVQDDLTAQLATMEAVQTVQLPAMQPADDSERHVAAMVGVASSKLPWLIAAAVPVQGAAARGHTRDGTPAALSTDTGAEATASGQHVSEEQAAHAEAAKAPASRGAPGKERSTRSPPATKQSSPSAGPGAAAPAARQQPAGGNGQAARPAESAPGKKEAGKHSPGAPGFSKAAPVLAADKQEAGAHRATAALKKGPASPKAAAASPKAATPTAATPTVPSLPAADPSAAGAPSAASQPILLQQPAPRQGTSPAQPEQTVPAAPVPGSPAVAPNPEQEQSLHDDGGRTRAAGDDEVAAAQAKEHGGSNDPGKGLRSGEAVNLSSDASGMHAPGRAGQELVVSPVAADADAAPTQVSTAAAASAPQKQQQGSGLQPAAASHLEGQQNDSLSPGDASQQAQQRSGSLAPESASLPQQKHSSSLPPAVGPEAHVHSANSDAPEQAAAATGSPGKQPTVKATGASRTAVAGATPAAEPGEALPQAVGSTASSLTVSSKGVAAAAADAIGTDKVQAAERSGDQAALGAASSSGDGAALAVHQAANGQHREAASASEQPPAARAGTPHANAAEPALLKQRDSPSASERQQLLAEEAKLQGGGITGKWQQTAPAVGHKQAPIASASGAAEHDMQAGMVVKQPSHYAEATVEAHAAVSERSAAAAVSRGAAVSKEAVVRTAAKSKVAVAPKEAGASKEAVISKDAALTKAAASKEAAAVKEAAVTKEAAISEKATATKEAVISTQTAFDRDVGVSREAVAGKEAAASMEVVVSEAAEVGKEATTSAGTAVSQEEALVSTGAAVGKGLEVTTGVAVSTEAMFRQEATLSKEAAVWEESKAVSMPQPEVAHGVDQVAQPAAGNALPECIASGRQGTAPSGDDGMEGRLHPAAEHAVGSNNHLPQEPAAAMPASDAVHRMKVVGNSRLAQSPANLVSPMPVGSAEPELARSQAAHGFSEGVEAELQKVADTAAIAQGAASASASAAVAATAETHLDTAASHLDVARQPTSDADPASGGGQTAGVTQQVAPNAPFQPQAQTVAQQQQQQQQEVPGGSSSSDVVAPVPASRLELAAATLDGAPEPKGAQGQPASVPGPSGSVQAAARADEQVVGSTGQPGGVAASTVAPANAATNDPDTELLASAAAVMVAAEASTAVQVTREGGRGMGASSTEQGQQLQETQEQQQQQGQKQQQPGQQQPKQEQLDQKRYGQMADGKEQVGHQAEDVQGQRQQQEQGSQPQHQRQQQQEEAGSQPQQQGQRQGQAPAQGASPRGAAEKSITVDEASGSTTAEASSSPAPTSRKDALKAIEPLLTEVRALKAALTQALRAEPNKALTEEQRADLARLERLLAELASYQQLLEQNHGKQYSVARQLGLLHGDLSKWFKSVQQQQQQQKEQEQQRLQRQQQQQDLADAQAHMESPASVTVQPHQQRPEEAQLPFAPVPPAAQQLVSLQQAMPQSSLPIPAPGQQQPVPLPSQQLQVQQPVPEAMLQGVSMLHANNAPQPTQHLPQSPPAVPMSSASSRASMETDVSVGAFVASTATLQASASQAQLAQVASPQFSLQPAGGQHFQPALAPAITLHPAVQPAAAPVPMSQPAAPKPAALLPQPRVPAGWQPGQSVAPAMLPAAAPGMSLQDMAAQLNSRAAYQGAQGGGGLSLQALAEQLNRQALHTSSSAHMQPPTAMAGAPQMLHDLRQVQSTGSGTAAPYMQAQMQPMQPMGYMQAGQGMAMSMAVPASSMQTRDAAAPNGAAPPALMMPMPTGPMQPMLAPAPPMQSSPARPPSASTPSKSSEHKAFSKLKKLFM